MKRANECQRKTTKPIQPSAVILGSFIAFLLISGVSASANPDASTLLAPHKAQGSSARYTIAWWTVDSGGGTIVAKNDYALHGTIGQADAGLLTSENYTLNGGFWNKGVLSLSYCFVYLPRVSK